MFRGLSRELQNRIHWVEVVLPKSDCMRDDQISGLEKIHNDLWVPWYGAAIQPYAAKISRKGRGAFRLCWHVSRAFASRSAMHSRTGLNVQNLRGVLLYRSV